MKKHLLFTMPVISMVISLGLSANTSDKPLSPIPLPPPNIPVISVNPTQISTTIQQCGDSAVVPVTIHNTGGAILNYTIGQATNFFEDFEAGLDKWVYNGMWQIVTDAYQGNGALKESPPGYYYNYMNQYIQTKDSFIVANKDSCALSFWLKYNTECCCDGVYADIQVNNGTWINLAYFACSGPWAFHSYNLSTHVNNGDYVKIRFRFYSDYSVVSSGIGIDNVELKGIGSASPWITPNPNSGAILPGDSAVVNFTFHSAGLIAGTYSGYALINSNDPITPSLNLPVVMTIIGAPLLEISPMSVVFPAVLQGLTDTATITVSNPGCDTLKVISITSDIPQFVPQITSLIIPPGLNLTVRIVFHPDSAILFEGVLTVTNGTLIQHVSLSGVGLPAPVISYNPDTIFVNLDGCNDSLWVHVNIGNNGAGNLYVLFGSLGSGGMLHQPLCTPSTIGWCCNMGIHQVIFNTINNTTGGGEQGYQDYTATQSTSLEKGTTYPITVITGNEYSENVRVWIDFNNDGDFNMSNELVFESLNTFQTHTGNVTIPANLVQFGAVRMRVMSEYYYYAAPTPCTNVTYGQTEDYKIFLGSGLIIIPDSVYLTPGDTTHVSVKFESQLFAPGTSYGSISLHSNDPVTPAAYIPFAVHKTGYPVIIPSVTSVTFPEIMINTSAHDSITIKNPGCDSLHVTQIISSNPNFSTQINSFSLAAQDSMRLVITFAPADTGQLSGLLELFNNAGNITINLNGHALGAPVISVVPDTVNALVTSCGDSVVIPVTVYNNGSAVLNYQVSTAGDFTEDFESGLGKWNYTGTWQIVSDAYQGTGALKEGPEGSYNNYMNETIEMKDPIQVLDAANCTLSYYLKRSLECCCDAIYTYISVNNAPWILLGQYTCTYDWTLITHNLSAYVTNGDYVKVRYGFISDGSVTYTGVHLDNIRLTGVNSPYPWLTYVPLADTVAIGGSSTLNLTFHSMNVPSGTYRQNLIIHNNDPLHPFITIPVTFTVSGLAQISVSNNTLNFPPVMQYASAMDSIWVYNHGCDTLYISGMNVSGPDYTVNAASSFVKPYDSLKLTIRFIPLTTGILNETLTLLNNVGDVIIALNGEGTVAPVISVHPDSLFAIINSCDDSVVMPVNIHNIGGLDLNWQASVAYAQTNYSLSFDGINSYVSLGYWIPGTKWTLEAWVNPSSTPAGRKTIVGGFGSCTDWGIVMQDGYFGVAVRPFGGNCSATFQSATPVVPGVWYHVCGTNDGTTARLYVNGVLMASGLVDPTYTGISYPYVGYEYCCYGNGFPGVIDEVRIWSQVIPVESILANMHRSLSGNEPGLFAYYDFNEGSGTTIYDKSMHGHTAYMGSATWQNFGAPVNTFMSLSPNSGTTVPTDSSTVNVTFHSYGMKNGVYHGTVSINSNSTLNPVVNIPATLTVNGTPNLVVPDTCISLGSIMEYTSKTDTVTLVNTGCDTLMITNIISNSGMYSVNPVSLTILPGSTQMIFVTFHPTSFGLITDTLHIISNDAEKRICVQGTATAIPYITVSTDLLSAAVVCEIEGSTSFWVKNIGAVPLTYSLAIANAPWLNGSPANGTLAPGDSLQHVFNYSKLGLETGLHSANIQVTSNDPLHNNLVIPFNFNVENSYKPVLLGTDKQVCVGSPVILHAGTGYSTYNWNTGSVDSILTVTASGDYSVTVADQASCIYSDSIHVQFYEYPVVYLGNDTTVCAGVTYTFNPSIQNLIPIAPSTVQVGTGTNYTGDVGPSPFGTYYMDDRTQMLYRSAELISLGLSPGLITSVAFNVGLPGSPVMQGFTIKMGNTASGNLTGFLSGLTTVYTTSSYNPAPGWNVFTLSQPFYWNGYQNIIVEVCFDNNNWSSSTSVQYTVVPGTVWSSWCDNCAPGCSVGGGMVFSERANIKLYGQGDVSIYTWHGPNGYVSHIRNAEINNIGFQNAGIYTLQVDNSVGCTDKDTIIIAVNPSPTVNAGVDQSIVYGTSTTLNGSATGGIAPYSYSWTPTTALSNPLISNPVANPLTTTVYRLTATGLNLCSGSDTMRLTVLPIYQIDGTITYANTQNTPLNNVIISLKNPQEVVIDTDTTGNNGAYLFGNLINGIYTYNINTQKTWGGVNATDALAINRHIVFLSSLTGLALSAADLNNSGTITAADALMVLRRTVGLISGFPAGDWTFSNTPIPVVNGNTTMNIQGMCMGDVNNSFVPGLKTEPSVFLSEQGYTGEIINNTLDIALKTQEPLLLGAMTLAFKLSDNIAEVVNITSPLKGLIWNKLHGNMIRIAWNDENGISFQQGDTLMMMKLLLKNNLDFTNPLLQVLDESEFAESDAKLIMPVRLSIPQLSLLSATNLTFDSYPNPFTEETVITWSVPADGEVTISLYDAYGQKVKELVKQTCQQGTHTLTLKGRDLAQGLYMATIQFLHNGISLNNTLRIIKTH